MTTQHTRSTKDIPAVFEKSHCITNTNLSLYWSCFFSKQINYTSEGELSRILHQHPEHTAYTLDKRYTISEGELSRILHHHPHHTAYMLHKRHITYVRKFTLRSKHRPLLLFPLFLRRTRIRHLSIRLLLGNAATENFEMGRAPTHGIHTHTRLH